jgi:hypothetical protein
MMVAEDTTAEPAALPMVEVPTAGKCSAATVGTPMLVVPVLTLAMANRITLRRVAMRDNPTETMVGRTAATVDTAATTSKG